MQKQFNFRETPKIDFVDDVGSTKNECLSSERQTCYRN